MHYRKRMIRETELKRRVVKLTGLLLQMALYAMILAGCTPKDAEIPQPDYEVKAVKCIYNYGDQDGAEEDIYAADGSVKQYIIVPYSDSGIDLFGEDLPSDDTCEKKEYTISEDEWDTIVNAVKSNNFMTLPEELPEVEAYDGSTCYIEIETSVGTHRSGGYCAGNGSGEEHQRFYNVKKALMDMEKTL